MAHVHVNSADNRVPRVRPPGRKRREMNSPVRGGLARDLSISSSAFPSALLLLPLSYQKLCIEREKGREDWRGARQSHE